MLRGIMDIQMCSIHSMRTIVYILLSLIFIGGSGCSAVDLFGLNKADREKLNTRVQGFYNNWVDNNNECINYLLPGVFDEKKMEEKLKKINLVGYSLNEIEFVGKNAKVSMNVEIIMDDDKITAHYYDYWEYFNNNWYISDCWRNN